MKMRSGEKIKLASVEDLLGVSNEENATDIEIARIQPFRNHPFYVRDDEQMDDLVDSIKLHGVLTPVLVRETDSGYEMISGHRRMHASIRAGLLTIPAIIRDMSDDEAIVYMVDANIQREELLPSEKAFAIKMKLDAMKRQTGRPSSGNVSQNGTHLRSDQELAEQIGSSRNQVQRYVRLTMLIPELLRMVDEKRIPFTLGVEISYLGESVQQCILAHCTEKGTVKPAQIKALRDEAQKGVLNREKAAEILEAANKRNGTKQSITIPFKRISDYFADDISEQQIIETIIGLLEKRESAIKNKENDSSADDPVICSND